MSGTDDPAFLDIPSLSALQATRKISAVELTRHQLERLEARGNDLNAVIYRDEESTLTAAAAVDTRRAAGAAVGALAGIVVTVKDSYAVQGMPCSAGTKSTLQVAPDDAPVVARARAEHAVVLGKTNVPPTLADYQAANEIYGKTVNPWDPTRSPGGSSGGSAASVSAGFSVADIGSDLSGSVRIPASWCGVFGHIPTFGLVSKCGHLPWDLSSRMEPTLSRTGPLARSADDLRIMLNAMIGPTAPMARGWTAHLEPASIVSLKRARIAIWRGSSLLPIDPDTQCALDTIASSLAEAGALIQELAGLPFSPEEAIPLFDRLRSAEIAHTLSEEDWASALQHEAALDGNSRGLTQSVRQHWRDRETQASLAAAWDSFFCDVDVMLLPAVSCPAVEHSSLPPQDRRIDFVGRQWKATELIYGWSKATNIVGAPATIFPAGPGRQTGLPIGLQVVGARFRDLTTIRVAELMQREEIISYRRPPGW